MNVQVFTVLVSKCVTGLDICTAGREREYVYTAAAAEAAVVAGGHVRKVCASAAM